MFYRHPVQCVCMYKTKLIYVNTKFNKEFNTLNMAGDVSLSKL